MTDFDLDRLGELWRQDPEPAEIERLRRTAKMVSRRARMAQIADTVGAIVVSVVMLGVTILNPQPTTVVVVTAALLMILYTFVRNRKLRETEIRMLSGTTEEMLDQSIERARATRKRMRLNLISVPVAIVVYSALIFAARRGNDPTILRSQLHLSEHMVLVTTIVLVLVAAFMTIGYARTFIRSRAELDSLEWLRDAYRRERDESQ
jgi:hypothetical protein